MAISLETESVEKQIQNLFLPIAQEIVNSATQNTLTIVDGHCGIGKTKSLIPLVEDLIKARDIAVTSCPEPAFFLENQDDIGDIIKRLPGKNGQKGVFIFDEASRYLIEQYQPRAKLIADIQRSTRCSLVAVTAYWASEEDSGKQSIDFWNEFGRLNLGVVANQIHLKDTVLNDELARAFLEEKFCGMSNRRTIDHILNVFPHTLSALGFISQNIVDKPELVNRHFLENIGDSAQIYIEATDIEEIKRRISKK